MTDDDELPQITERLWEPIEAEGLFDTDDQVEPVRHVARPADAVPALKSSSGPSDPPEKESAAPLPSVSREPGGGLTRTAPLFLLFMFSMSIMFLIGLFIGASRTANLPTRPPPAEASVPAPLSPPKETPTPDSSTAGYSSPEPATSQPGPVDMTITEAAPAPSSSAPALRESAPAAPDPVPPSTPASEPPAVVVTDAPPVPAVPAPEPPMPSETVASTPPPIAPATVPIERDIQTQVLLSRGDAFFSAGDVTSARFFYQRGADAGDGAAALRLGETFDAAFLERAHLGHVPGNLTKAVFWYRQARALGNAEAEILLKSLRAD